MLQETEPKVVQVVVPFARQQNYLLIHSSPLFNNVMEETTRRRGAFVGTLGTLRAAREGK